MEPFKVIVEASPVIEEPFREIVSPSPEIEADFKDIELSDSRIEVGAFKVNFSPEAIKQDFPIQVEDVSAIVKSYDSLITFVSVFPIV